MPPPGCTQLSSSRRRGRPPKTPTKGPDPKKVKTLEEDAAVVSGTVDSSANSSSAAPPPNGSFYCFIHFSCRCCLRFARLLTVFRTPGFA